MKSKYKKIYSTMGLSLFLFLLVISFLLIFSYQKTELVQHAPNLSTQLEWGAYDNTAAGYSFLYPSAYTTVTTEGNSTFVSDKESQFWYISVSIDSTNLASADAWIAQENAKSSSAKELGITIVHEKQIMLDGLPAVVTYQEGSESNPEEKTVVLIQDGKLYLLSSRLIDHEKFWSSFTLQ